MADPLYFVDVIYSEQALGPESVGLLQPDAVLASTNLSNLTIANIQDDPDSPDANWFTATSATAATDLRVSFSSPLADPYGAQNFRYLLRKTTGTSNPTINAELRQNNVLRRTVSTDIPITSTSGQVIQGDWVATDLVGTVDGSDVEVRIVSTPGQASSPGALPVMNATAGTLVSSATLTGSRNINIPTHVNGDLLVLVCGMFNTNLDQNFTSINTAGWTQAGGANNEYGTGTRAAVGFGWKIGNGSETAVNVTIGGGSGTDRFLGRVYRFTATNGFANPPIQNIGTQVTSGSSTSMGMPSVTRVTPNDLALAVCAAYSSTTMAAATGETGGNWTEVVGESAATNGTIGIQRSAYTGATISGGTSTLGTAGIKTTIGCSIVPASILTNETTVEIGAIEWNVSFLSFVTADADGAAMLQRSAAPISLDGVAGLLGTRTANADAIALAIRTAAPSADAAILTTQLAAPSLDVAVLAQARTSTASADGAANLVRTASTSANVIAQIIREIATSASGVTLAVLSHDISADAAIKIARAPISATADGTVSIGQTLAAQVDGVAQRVPSETIIAADADMVVAAVFDHAHDADSVIIASLSVAPLADAYILDQSVLSAISSLDGIVRDVRIGASSMDIAAYTIFTAESSLDMYIAEPAIVVVSYDTAIQTSADITASLNAFCSDIASIFTVYAMVDAITAARNTVGCVADSAIIYGESHGTYLVSATVLEHICTVPLLAHSVTAALLDHSTTATIQSHSVTVMPQITG